MNWVDPWGLKGGPGSNPPPVDIPYNEDPNNEWEYVPNPDYDSSDSKSRPGKWKPKNPVKVPGGKGGQPSGSFDQQGEHWDVKDGTGKTDRYDEEGNPLTPEEAHDPNRNTGSNQSSSFCSTTSSSNVPAWWWYIPLIPLTPWPDPI